MKRLIPYIAALIWALPLQAQDNTSVAATPSAPNASSVPSDMSADSQEADVSAEALSSVSGEASARPLSLPLPTKAEADSAYVQEDYATAAQFYQMMIDSCGGSAQLYYNLGNCYYRQDSIARAILNYERARLLDPSDDDIRFNLEMARAKTVDRVMPANEMFFVSLFHRLVLSFSLQTWSWLGLLTFLLMLAAIAAYFFLPTLSGKKIGFTVAIVALLISLFANLAAYQQLHHMEDRDNAVIMSSSVVVKSTPSQAGTDLFILHEGTRVEIKDDTMNDWVEVQVSDGKAGWISRSDIEII